MDQSLSIGLTLGSGGARGWAHVGVLRALDELGVRPDVVAGASIGAVVGGAYLIDQMPAFEAWARAFSPLSALRSFRLDWGKGGVVETSRAFDAFRESDRRIEDLDRAFGVVAADLATGEQVWISRGSVLDAARASSAVPALFQAVEREGRWLVDGALANPLPVDLTRSLGADVVLAVDLNAHPRVLKRFDRPPASPPVVHARRPGPLRTDALPPAIRSLIEDTQRYVTDQLDFARARQRAKPHFFETALASVDIFQTHLTRGNLVQNPPDVHIRPRVQDAPIDAFDNADPFIEEGYRATMEERGAILEATAGKRAGAPQTAASKP